MSVACSSVLPAVIRRPARTDFPSFRIDTAVWACPRRKLCTRRHNELLTSGAQVGLREVASGIHEASRRRGLARRRLAWGEPH